MLNSVSYGPVNACLKQPEQIRKMTVGSKASVLSNDEDLPLRSIEFDHKYE